MKASNVFLLDKLGRLHHGALPCGSPLVIEFEGFLRFFYSPGIQKEMSKARKRKCSLKMSTKLACIFLALNSGTLE